MIAGAAASTAAPATAELKALVERIEAARAAAQPLRIVGGDTKAFYGEAVPGEALALSACRGIVAYEPSELVITARAGTPLAEVEAALAAHDQMLGFEPPALGAASTIGGVIAAGLSGPARPYRGSARDFVLGLELINGHAQVLRFGGQVMKNVAGYDVSRLMCGALGTLGVITAVSLRVLPRPRAELTLVWELPRTQALARMLELPRRPWPITAMACLESRLLVRVAGSEAAVVDARTRLAPDEAAEHPAFWSALRDYTLPALAPAPGEALWRLALPPAAGDPEGLPSRLVDWGGAQRWVLADDAAGEALRRHCAKDGGHATRWRGVGHSPVFSPPGPALADLMRRIKRAFDPLGIFNRGRLFPGL